VPIKILNEMYFCIIYYPDHADYLCYIPDNYRTNHLQPAILRKHHEARPGYSNHPKEEQAQAQINLITIPNERSSSRPSQPFPLSLLREIRTLSHELYNNLIYPPLPLPAYPQCLLTPSPSLNHSTPVPPNPTRILLRMKYHRQTPPKRWLQFRDQNSRFWTGPVPLIRVM